MTDKRKGIIYLPFKLILYIISLVYGIAIGVRRLLYSVGIFKRHKVPIKVISVGNLTLGGTGKTPFVIRLAGILDLELKKRTAVLIRGYGWDEQAMLKKNLPDTPILVGEDRVKSAHKAIRLYGSEAAILDDGFQHWELARDLDIVLVDATNPFGNGCLFPRGVLREPKSSIARADVVVFTKVNKKTAAFDAAKDELKKLNGRLQFIEAAHKPKHLYDAKARKELSVSTVRGKKVYLVSSIGDPAYFEETVKDLGADVVGHIAFGDHHDYRPKDVERIMKMCAQKPFDLLVTTEKDAVKLARMSISFGNYKLLTLVITLEIVSGREVLVDRLHSIYRSQVP